MKQKHGYEGSLKNTGAQDVPALRKGSGVKKAAVTRGRDLRSGK